MSDTPTPEQTLTRSSARRLGQDVNTRREPIPPESWHISPDYFPDGPSFEAAMNQLSVEFVYRHWRWAINNGEPHGHGLVGHHNFLKGSGPSDSLPGVLMNGEPVRREGFGR